MAPPPPKKQHRKRAIHHQTWWKNWPFPHWNSWTRWYVEWTPQCRILQYPYTCFQDLIMQKLTWISTLLHPGQVPQSEAPLLSHNQLVLICLSHHFQRWNKLLDTQLVHNPNIDITDNPAVNRVGTLHHNQSHTPTSCHLGMFDNCSVCLGLSLWLQWCSGLPYTPPPDWEQQYFVSHQSQSPWDRSDRLSVTLAAPVAPSLQQNQKSSLKEKTKHQLQPLNLPPW